MEKQLNTEKAGTSKTTKIHYKESLNEQNAGTKGNSFWTTTQHRKSRTLIIYFKTLHQTLSVYVQLSALHRTKHIVHILSTSSHRAASYIANYEIIRIVRVCLIRKGTQFDPRYTNGLRLAPSTMPSIVSIPANPVVDVGSGHIGAMPQCALRHIEPRWILHNDPGTGKVDDDKAVGLPILLCVARHDSLGFVPVIDVNGRSPGTELEVIDSNATLIRQHHAQRVAIRHAVCFYAEIDNVIRS